jgi:hypothetical protein
MLAVTMSLFGGCTGQVPLPSGAIRVPTDETLVNATASGILCVGSTVPPFVGILEGDPSDLAWPVWLRAEDGRRMYITWPKGFSVRFDPYTTLLDETGAPVLYAGSPFTFEGVAHDARVGHCYHQPAGLVGDMRGLLAAFAIALALTFGTALVLTGLEVPGH